MEIKTIGHTSEHNLWLVATLFFDEDEDVLIESKADIENGTLTVETKIYFEDKVYDGIYSYPCQDKDDENAVKRLCNAISGMSFEKAAQKIRPKHLPWGVMTGIRPAKPARRRMLLGESEESIRRYLAEAYGISEAKIDLAVEVAKNELETVKGNKPNDIGLYIGIPFCPTKCLYCSFISSDLRYTKKYVKDYTRLLKKEIEYCAEKSKQSGINISSIYIGGGTPTSLEADELKEILVTINKYADLSSLKEFSVEAGRPDTITREKLQVLKDYGVGRISINPQTMNESTLKTIGRSHSPDDIKKAFEIANAIGFDCINADVIAGLPDEDEQMFAYTLEELRKLDPENITVHTMSIKKGSVLKAKMDNYSLSAAQTVENMLDISQAFMKETGRLPYYMYRQKHMLGNLENVGYSKPGHFSVYNINIMEEVQSILALGGGGVSKVVEPKADRIERIFNFKTPIDYIERFDEIISRKDEFFDMIVKTF